MLRACREGRIDLILCKSVSRFGRNSVDVLRTIRALRERNIGVLFEKEAVDTRTMNSELILAFHSAFSQSESESISGNVRWGCGKPTRTAPSPSAPTCTGSAKGRRAQWKSMKKKLRSSDKSHGGSWTGTASIPSWTSWPNGRSPAPKARTPGAPPLYAPSSPMRSTKGTPSSKRLTAPACSPTGRCRTMATCPSIMWRACSPGL